MAGIGMKYATLIAVIVAMFVNFVACGSQFYKASLKDDTQLSSTNDAAAQDPASPTFGLHSPGGWMTLPVHFKASSELNKEQMTGLLAAMNIWETAVGRKLFVFEGSDTRTGDSFGNLNNSLRDSINGMYLDDDWAKLCPDKSDKDHCKSPQVLATTIWTSDEASATKIDTADIRFNSNFYLIGDAFAKATEISGETREHVDMATLATHELGHLLGLSHIPAANDADSIMNPALYIGEGLSNRRLSKGDLQRIQKIYGCAGEACNSEATLDKIDQMSREDTNDSKTKTPATMQDTAH